MEAGVLELQSVRLVQSLRKFGGRFAEADIIAVTPRFGPSLSKNTRIVFDNFHVDYRKISPSISYRWNSYLNKPLALIEGEIHSKTSEICWLDTDILVMDEPTDLSLHEGEDFVACAPDKNIGTDGSDEFAPYWHELCRVLGIRFDDIPMITTHRDNQKIRLYFNSGAFAYRKSTMFGESFLNNCLKLLDAKIASHESGIFFTDQVALVLTMIQLNLRWRALSLDYNLALGEKIEQLYKPGSIASARILHYHDAMWLKYWPTFLSHLKQERPPIYEWVSPMGPLQIDQAFDKKTLGECLRFIRKFQANRHLSKCRVF